MPEAVRALKRRKRERLCSTHLEDIKDAAKTMLLAIPAMEKSINTLPEDIRPRNLDVVIGWQAVLSLAAGAGRRSFL